jgi:hypothetical protein
MFIDKFDEDTNLDTVSKIYKVLDLSVIKLLMTSKYDLFDQKFILILLQIIKVNEND